MKNVLQKLMVPLLMKQMLTYNLIDYSDNYSDTSGILWGFKRDEIDNNA